MQNLQLKIYNSDTDTTVRIVADTKSLAENIQLWSEMVKKFLILGFALV